MSPYIIDIGSENDNQSIKLVTRTKKYIKNCQYPIEPIEKLKAANEITARNNPAAELRAVCSEYNCMGLVFASRRTTIEIDQLRFILQEDGYIPLQNVYQAKTGDA